MKLIVIVALCATLCSCGRTVQEGDESFAGSPINDRASGQTSQSGQGQTTPQINAGNNSTLGSSNSGSANSGSAAGSGTQTTPPARNTPNSTSSAPPGTCGGMAGEGGCWYLAAEEQSCTDLCESHHGYSDATNLIVGHRGTDEQCRKIAAALAGPTKDSTGTAILKGLGQQLFPTLTPALVNLTKKYPFETKDVRTDLKGDEEDLQFAYSPGCTIHKGPKNDYAIITRYYGVDSNPDDGAFGTRRVCGCKG